ncbi:MAG: hypothetical protein U5L08_06440 [Xanthomonadales bacterium]|nr:hypothetical protein [Xanthomonadales bacterium]
MRTRSPVSGWVRDPGGLALPQQDLLVFQNAHELDQTPRRVAGALHVADRRLVGGAFLGAAVGQHVGQAEALPERGGGHPGGRVAGHGRGPDPQQQAADHPGREILHLPSPAGQMAGGDVAGLVGDHAHHLGGRLARCSRPVWRNMFMPPATNAFSVSSAIR